MPLRRDCENGDAIQSTLSFSVMAGSSLCHRMWPSRAEQEWKLFIDLVSWYDGQFSPPVSAPIYLWSTTLSLQNSKFHPNAYLYAMSIVCVHPGQVEITIYTCLPWMLCTSDPNPALVWGYCCQNLVHRRTMKSKKMFFSASSCRWSTVMTGCTNE